MGQAEIAGDSRLVPQWRRVHGRDVQERCEDDIRQRSCIEGSFRSIQSSLEGNVRRAIDIHEGDKINEAGLKDLIRAAVALNLEGKTKPKTGRENSKRGG